MKRELEKAFRKVRTEIADAIIEHDMDDQAEFFGELADWAYRQHEALSLDADLETQDYEE